MCRRSYIYTERALQINSKYWRVSAKLQGVQTYKTLIIKRTEKLVQGRKWTKIPNRNSVGGI
jgi:hypothetical protein